MTSMSEQTRIVLRLLVDRARRAQLEREFRDATTWVCGYCHQDFEKTQPRQRFCCSRHRRMAHDSSPVGAATRRAYRKKKSALKAAA